MSDEFVYSVPGWVRSSLITCVAWRLSTLSKKNRSLHVNNINERDRDMRQNSGMLYTHMCSFITEVAPATERNRQRCT